jgi:hypothetical protein
MEKGKFLLKSKAKGMVGDMCKIGDIIVVYQYKDAGKRLSTHSFVVLDDRNGQIRGIDFDFVALVMSSIKDEEQKQRKLAYPGNFPIVPEDLDIEGDGNEKSAYIKVEQFYFFNKNKLSYRVLGKLDTDIFNLLIEFIEELEKNGVRFRYITDNLS